MQKLTIRAVWRDLSTEKMPILALKGGLIRQTDRDHRIVYCLSGVYNAALFWWELRIWVLYKGTRTTYGAYVLSPNLVFLAQKPVSLKNSDVFSVLEKTNSWDKCRQTLI